jgi:hypothetical protein
MRHDAMSIINIVNVSEGLTASIFRIFPVQEDVKEYLLSEK